MNVKAYINEAEWLYRADSLEDVDGNEAYVRFDACISSEQMRLILEDENVRLKSVHPDDDAVWAFILVEP